VERIEFLSVGSQVRHFGLAGVIIFKNTFHRTVPPWQPRELSVDPMTNLARLLEQSQHPSSGYRKIPALSQPKAPLTPEWDAPPRLQEARR
jgi:hypothetical protein